MVSELEGIINAFPGMISVVDKEFNVLLANREMIRQFGESRPEDVLNKKCYRVRKKLKKICPECAIKDAMESGRVISRTSTEEEEKLMGIATKAYAVPLQNEEGIVWGGVEVIMDVSDIRQAEYAIKESEERYKRLAEAAFEGICILYNDEIVDVNSRILEIFQMSREEFLARPFSKLVHKDDLNMVMKVIRKNIKSDYEFRGIRKDGTVLCLEARGNPIIIDNRMYRLTVVSDITGRKITENALREKVSELEQFNRAIIDQQELTLKLKREVNKLYRRLGKQEKYQLPAE